MHLRFIARVLLVPFVGLTLYTLYDVGVLAVFEHQLASSGGWHVFADLSIALTLLMVWMVPDARRTGRNPYLYVIITLIAGAFGPLLYFALSKPDDPTKL